MPSKYEEKNQTEKLVVCFKDANVKFIYNVALPTV